MSLRRFPGPLAGCVHRTALIASPSLTAVQVRNHGFDPRIDPCTTAKITVQGGRRPRQPHGCELSPRDVMGRRASPWPSSSVL